MVAIARDKNGVEHGSRTVRVTGTPNGSRSLLGYDAGVARRTLDIDVVATYKFLIGLALFAGWLVFLVVAAGYAFGGLRVAAVLLAAAAAFVALPLAERTAEDVQAIRGFMRRHDTSLAGVIEERERLLEAFPDLIADGGG